MRKKWVSFLVFAAFLALPALLIKTAYGYQAERTSKIHTQKSESKSEIKNESKSRTIRSGRFTKKKQRIKGKWLLTETADGQILSFDAAFKTKKAPDLKLFLSPLTFSETNGKNAGKNAYFIANLKSEKGVQSYKIPKNITLSNYKSLLIHCKQYSILWGGASLEEK